MLIGTISTQISIIDRMTTPLRTISNSLSGMARILQNVDGSLAGSFDTREVDNLRRSADLLNRELDELENANLNINNGGFNNSINQSNSLVSKLKNGILGVVATWASFEGARKVIEISDNLTQTTARLSMLVDTEEELVGLQQQIFDAAERSRASFSDMSSIVAKLGMNAKDAFSNNDETIQFAENLNKMFVIAGASVQEVESATLQLTQALGSGILRGEELNAVFESAPNIIQLIADYMDKPIGAIRNMASEGDLSAEVVKNAMLGASVAIEEQFATMPLTFAQIWQSFKNNALLAFEPIFIKLREFANSQDFNLFVQNAINALYYLADICIVVFENVAILGNYIADNWSTIGPIVYGVVIAFFAYNAIMRICNITAKISTGIQILQTIAAYAYAWATKSVVAGNIAANAAQLKLNAAVLACPWTWIIILIAVMIVVVFALAAALMELEGITCSVTGAIMGYVFAVGAFIANLVMGVLEFVLGVIELIWNAVVDLTNFLGNAFHSPLSTAMAMFRNFGDAALGVIEAVASALDLITGQNWAGAVSGFRTTVQNYWDGAIEKYAPEENYKEFLSPIDLNVADIFNFERFNYTDAASAGYRAGTTNPFDTFELDTGIVDKVTSLIDPSNIPSYDELLATDLNDIAGVDDSIYSGGSGGSGSTAGSGGSADSAALNDIANNTGAMANSMDMSEEDLSYLRDLAQRDAINKFTTAEVSVALGGITNNVSKNVDVDGIVDYLVRNVSSALEVVADGSY